MLAEFCRYLHASFIRAFLWQGVVKDPIFSFYLAQHPGSSRSEVMIGATRPELHSKPFKYQSAGHWPLRSSCDLSRQLRNSNSAAVLLCDALGWLERCAQLLRRRRVAHVALVDLLGKPQSMCFQLPALPAVMLPVV